MTQSRSRPKPAKKRPAKKTLVKKTLVKKPGGKADGKPVRKPAAKKAEKPSKTPGKKSPAKSNVAGIRHWLFKSEPDKWSWRQQKAKGRTGEEWDGIRNYQARNNMRAMQLGDLGFFYHSNEGKEIVGIIEVCKLVHPDSTTDDERWECVDLRAICDMPKPVTLADVKASDKLQQMSLVTSMRLSVQPVTKREWDIVCRMGGLDPKKINSSYQRAGKEK